MTNESYPTQRIFNFLLILLACINILGSIEVTTVEAFLVSNKVTTSCSVRPHHTDCHQYLAPSAFTTRRKRRMPLLFSTRLQDETSNPITESAATKTRDKFELPPIPDPAANPEDDGFRQFRRNVPTRIQSWMRDTGVCRWISDSLIWLAVPSLLQEQPHVLGDFLRLTVGGQFVEKLSSLLPLMSLNNTKLSNVAQPLVVTKHVYGNKDDRQFVSFIQQEGGEEGSFSGGDTKDRTIVFLHGGAWGSGFPSMYALAATPFLNAGYNTVAMVGYRTFPTTMTINGQLEDVAQALEKILKETPTNSKITIVGHSSGAHLLALGFQQGRFDEKVLILQDNAQETATTTSRRIDQFIGMAGVYDIYKHYKWEQGRGVERMSAMAKICGNTAAKFRQNSPTYVARSLKETQDTPSAVDMFPKKSILLHGDLDRTVSYQISKDMADASGVSWKLLDGVGHAEMVLELMFGGTTSDFVLDWIRQESD